MSRFRVQFTIGRLMVGVAVAAVLCWIATDATVGPVLVGTVGRRVVQLGTLAAILVLVQLGTLAAFWAVCGVLTWLSDRLSARGDPPPCPAGSPPTDRTLR